MGYNILDLYDMTIYELDLTFKNARKGLAYRLWKQSTITASMFSKNPYSSPEYACPELYPPKPTIKIPQKVFSKYMRRKGVMR